MSDIGQLSAERIRALMKQGYDTLDIARQVNAALGRAACTEADIYNTLARSKGISYRSAA